MQIKPYTGFSPCLFFKNVIFMHEFVHKFMCEFAREFVQEFFTNFVHEFKYEIRIRTNSYEFLQEKLVMLRMACTVTKGNFSPKKLLLL